MVKRSLTGPWSYFHLYFSVLAFVFMWTILSEQKDWCLSRKFGKPRAGSSVLFLDFPFSRVPLCFLLSLGRAGRRDEFSRLSSQPVGRVLSQQNITGEGSYAKKALLVEKFLDLLSSRIDLCPYRGTFWAMIRNFPTLK